MLTPYHLEFIPEAHTTIRDLALALRSFYLAILIPKSDEPTIETCDAWLAGFVSPSAAEQRGPARDEEVKVAVLVKLIQFVTWPDAAAARRGQTRFRYAYWKRTAGFPLLQQMVQGEFERSPYRSGSHYQSA